MALFFFKKVLTTISGCGNIIDVERKEVKHKKRCAESSVDVQGGAWKPENAILRSQKKLEKNFKKGVDKHHEM